MRKTQSQQPMMVAYIIFLCVCGGYYIVSGIFKLEFPVWQRVVAAATIASYFFSLCSVPKLSAKMSRKQLDYISDQNALYKKILQKETKIHTDDGKLTKTADFINRQLTENQEEAVKNQKEIVKMGKQAFWLDVAGFLAFFCILTFDGIYAFVAKSLDWYTLLAFILVLFVEYLESTKVSFYDELCKESIDNLREILALLEEK